MVKYIYYQRPTTTSNTLSQRSNTPIIHTNLSTYTETLMTIHESDPVPEQSSQKDSRFSPMLTSPLRKGTLLLRYPTDS